MHPETSFKLVAPRSATALVLLALALVVALLFSTTPASAWTKTAQMNRQGVKLLQVDVDAGNRGYSVIGWRQISNSAPLIESKVVGFVRIKRPGSRWFGTALRLGKVRTGPSVTIGDHGHTVVTFSRLNGVVYAMVRGPRTRWSKPQRIRGDAPKWAGAKVGPDGSTVLWTSSSRSTTDPNAKVMISTKLPGKRRFSRWRKVSGAGSTVGFDSDVVVGRRGRATVVWSGPCPLSGSARNAMYVDIAWRQVGRPREIPNSKCVTWDLDLEMDGAGYQYLRFGGSEASWMGVKYGVRAPDQRFPALQLASEPGKLTNGGSMAVSARGRVFLVWFETDLDDTSTGKTRYLTLQRRRPIGGPAELAGTVHDSTRRTSIGDMAFMPDGSLSVFWREIRILGPNRSMQILGIQRLDPMAPEFNPSVVARIPPALSAQDRTLAVAPDGSQLALWTISRLGWPRVVRWISAPGR